MMPPWKKQYKDDLINFMLLSTYKRLTTTVAVAQEAKEFRCMLEACSCS